jgi:ubiquinone/menaquinone biosynthesis C-methylase UbiE
MSEENKNLPYLHGFNEEEQSRLQRQAAFAEHTVYRNVDLSDVSNLLEVGCGVGAQSAIILRRFPNIQLTGIDLNKKQLETANTYLNTIPYAKGRFDIQEMDAENMNFKANQFDGAFLCWILEHVKDPARILNEVRRVVRPGGKVYVTEVMNSSFFLDPYSPNVWKYWMAFNEYQYDGAGDPFVGAKLGNLLTSVGFQRVRTEVVTWHLDNRHPEKRRQVISYWSELLMSAVDQLIASKYTTKEIADAALKELNHVEKNPNAVFMYSFMQARATVI